MDELTFYDQLGLPRDATPEEIRRAYHQLVFRLHPDKNVNKGETELFIDIHKAYECLSNPSRKKKYDESLPEAQVQSVMLDIKTYYSQASILRLREPQLIYSLL